MKYRKCPRCELNYITADEELCLVCKNEMQGKRSIFDDEDAELVLCPYCERNFMGVDDLMCKQCEKKRKKLLADKSQQ